MVENIWKYAVENKMRFAYRGGINTEDLFDLSMNALDEIYKNVMREYKEKSNEESGLSGRKMTDETEYLEVAAELVKAVYMQMKEEKESRENAKAVKEKKQLIADLINKKKNQALENLSVEELTAMLGNM